jgi:hypothetical protein
MRAPVTAPIPGARRTELAAGALTADGLATTPKAEFEQLGVTWSEYLAQARENAAADLPELTVEYTRNRNKVIQYATLRSERGLLPAMLLTPKFLAQFEETLGPTILLVIPNRFTAFAFPKLVSNYRDYSTSVLDAYRATSYPVSLEVFELSKEGLQAVGVYADPGKD